MSRFRLTLMFLLFSIFMVACRTTDFETSDFQISFIGNIDNAPVFEWEIKSNISDFEQCKVRIIVANNQHDLSNDTGNIWDSGKVNIENAYSYKYNGDALTSGQKYFAKIKIWNRKGECANWCDAKSFYVPLNYPNDWKSKWITFDYNREKPLPVFRNLVEPNPMKQVESARLYIAAPGFYEAFINGRKIGENVLDPAQTNYEDYTYYTVYDLSESSLQSPFELRVMLGNGWYNQNVVWGNGLIYGHPLFNAQLHINYEDGTSDIIGTDESWEWSPGPILYSNIYAGETYDARAELNGKSDSVVKWKKATLASKHPTNLIEQFAEPIKRMGELNIKGIFTKEDGRYIIDFGENFTGWIRLKFKGEKGQELTMKCVEELDDNDEIDPRTTGIRATKVVQTLKYICKGNEIEEWEPRFTYFGFRYAEVSGLTQHPEKDFLTGIKLYSAMDNIGSFSCSEENVNKLHQLANQTIIGNVQGIPTDCPHREKCGWTGDIHAYIDALHFNYNAKKFISKYMFDMRSSARRENKELYFGESFHDRSFIKKPKGIPTMIVPGKRTSGVASPDWGTAVTQLPWSLYLYYADTIMMGNFYPDMKIWVEYIHAKMDNGVIPHGLGDWCPPGGNENIDCPVPVSSSAFHILDLKNITEAARVLGYSDEFNLYARWHKQAISDFNESFLDKTEFTYGSQTANSMALDIGIVPEDMKQKVAQSIVHSIENNFDGFISTGIFGISRIFRVLADNGFEQKVYELLTKKGENSFAYMWDHYNATTLWEVLPVYKLKDEMEFRSHSHPMQAGYDAWFYTGIAGINPVKENPGFKKIVFKPYLTQHIEQASAEYKSVFGTIKSSWKTQNGKFVWEIVIPENTSGEIFIPNYHETVDISVNGKRKAMSNFSYEFTSIGLYDSGQYLIEMTR